MAPDVTPACFEISYTCMGSHLKRHEPNERSKTVCGHKSNILALITHPTQHWNHQEYNIRDHAHTQLLNYT